jgi:uncharacterized protein
VRGHFEKSADLRRKLGLAGAIFAVPTAGGVLARTAGAPPWILIASAAVGLVGAVVTLIITWKQGRAEVEESRRRLWKGELQQIGVAARDPDYVYRLGVETEAEDALTDLGWAGLRHAPYVGRDVDEKVRNALRQAAAGDGSSLIVVSGRAKSGKSRTLLEAASSELSDAWLLQPSDPKSLGALAQGGPPPELPKSPCVTWLDDIEAWVRRGNEGLSPETLNNLARWDRPVLVLATEGGKGLGTAGSQLGEFDDMISDLLRQYPGVRLGHRLTRQERRRLEREHTPVGDKLARVGLGEFLVAGSRLVEKLEHGRHRRDEPRCLEGQAVVWAAIDWRLTGILRPIPERVLRALVGHYSPVTPTEARFERGREWALEPLYEDVALLRRAVKFGHEEAYEPFDFIVEHAQRSEHQIDPSTFDRIIAEYAEPAELARVGLVARALGDNERAKAAWRRGDGLGDAAASVNLGRLLHERGDMRSAGAAWRRADAQGHPDAALLLAFHESGRGNERKAAASLVRGVKRGDRRASVPLGKMYLRQKRFDAAEAAFRRGDLLGDAEAAHQLGHLYFELGRLDDADAAWRRADDRGSATASVDVAGRLFEKGDLEGTEAALRRADERGHPDAPLHIGQIRYGKRDLRGAEIAFGRADELGYPDASYMLGEVLRERRDFPGAVAAKRRAEAAYGAAGDSKMASVVALQLGILLSAIAQDDAAQAAFQRAHRSPDPEIRWRARDRQDFYARARQRWPFRLRRRLGIAPRPIFTTDYVRGRFEIRHE